MNIIYTQLGVASEYLLRLCALKANWDEYLKHYKPKPKEQKRKQNQYRSFECARQFLINDIKDNNRLTDEQLKRIELIIECIQIQRNHFVHNPFKAMDHYAFKRQIYLLLGTLAQIYDLDLPEEAIEILLDNIERHRVISGMDFEDVGLEQYAAKLN